MRLAFIVLALACVAMAEEKVAEALPAAAALAAEPVAEVAGPTAVEPEAAASAPEVSKPGKSSRSNDQAPKVYYARPAAPVQHVAQARDGAHHHDHGHHEHHAAPAPIQYSQPAPQAYEPQPNYDQAPQQYAPQAPQSYEHQPQPYNAPAPSYDAAPQYPQAAPAPYSAPAPTYEQPAAPAYSTPGHQGYYYYYYPVKDSKVKLKLPKLPKMPSLPSLRLPEYYGKDGGVSSVKSFGVAAITAALVGVGAFLSLPIIGLGVGKRSFSSLWESEYLSRDNLNVLAEYIINIVDNYKPSNQ